MTRTSYAKAAAARDDGLRRVRKLTWRAGLVSAAAATLIGAKFSHFTVALPHFSFNGSSSSTGSDSGNPAGTSPSSGFSPSSGVSSSSGGAAATSGGS